jgi:hypothetical protein
MAEELGKIEKPEAESVSGKRKLLVVPMTYYAQNAPEQYMTLFNKYWEQASEHIANLEAKIGGINHVYHESIAIPGQEALDIIEKLNPVSHKIIKQKSDAGATIEAAEDRELVEEGMDWERCLMMGFISQKVANKISEFYFEVAKKRYEKMTQIIDKTLKKKEVGAIFIREGHMIQFPKDIEVFSVSPPALVDIHRGQREYMDQHKNDEVEEKKADK